MCDASPFGIGAILSHILDDATEHPDAYASHSLSPAKKVIHNWTKKQPHCVL